MRYHRLLLGVLAFSTPALVADAIPAPASPQQGRLAYAVYRDGEPVGQHLIDFTRQGDSTSVRISTNVAVKVAFITVYRFEHQGFESWQGNHLVALKSQTNDDGTPHEISVSLEGDHLRVAADGSQGTAPAGILPGSLWNVGVVHQSSLLNTLDGTLMRVSVQDEGEDLVPTAGGKISAHHYKISGGLDRDVWFDGSNNLVRLRFAAKDGSDIVYVLQ